MTADAAPDQWMAIEIGCQICDHNSNIIGVYRDVDDAITAADNIYDAHPNPCEQYTTEVHKLPPAH